jgi:hypothetical protein
MDPNDTKKRTAKNEGVFMVEAPSPEVYIATNIESDCASHFRERSAKKARSGKTEMRSEYITKIITYKQK